MSIFVSEPGRPIGTRLPEAFRSRRVGDVTELSESASISAEHSEATDAEGRPYISQATRFVSYAW